MEGVDLLVSGNNGDARYSSIYHHIHELFSGSIVTGYKHLVGEYDTASAFGMYLASKIIHGNVVPESIRINRRYREIQQHSRDYRPYSGG